MFFFENDQGEFMENQYICRIIDVNLTTNKIKEINLDEKIVKQYMGGVGFVVKIITDQVGTDVEPFSEHNIVALATGPMSGTSATATGRVHIGTKSPLTGIMGMGNFGGAFGIRLRKAGFEGIIIRGKSNKPKFLYINNGDIKLKEAYNLWGKDTFETTDSLKNDLGNDISVLAIGPAGENKVKFAMPVADYYHAPGRSSTGCILGDKKLKAIVVRGTSNIKVADKVKFHEAVIEATDRIIAYPDKGERRKIGSHASRFMKKSKQGLIRTGNFANYELRKDSDFLKLPSSLADNIIYREDSFGEKCVMAPYYGCDLEGDVQNGPYTGVRLGGIGFSNIGGDWGIRLGIKTYPAMFKGKELCNRYGIDTGNPISFAMELLENGIINKEDVDGLELKLGNEKEIFEMLRKIAYREGFGNILAEGTAKAARLIGKGAEKFALTLKDKQIYEPDISSMGVARVLGMMTCLRGGDDLTSTHTINDTYSFPDWAKEMDWSKEKYLSWLIDYIDMFPEEKEKIYSSHPSVDFLDRRSSTGKARLVVWFEHITTVVNALGLCIVSTNMVPALGPTHMAKMYSACTGLRITPRELMKNGERIFNLLKTYNISAGLRREDDMFPLRYFEEPISGGPYQGETMLSREQMEKLLDEYYEVRDWDVQTGIPKKEKLQELNLGDVTKKIK